MMDRTMTGYHTLWIASRSRGVDDKGGGFHGFDRTIPILLLFITPPARMVVQYLFQEHNAITGRTQDPNALVVH